MERIVRCIKGSDDGHCFIETRPAQFEERMRAHKRDRALPEPMPYGHLMFTHPEDYGCIKV